MSRLVAALLLLSTAAQASSDLRSIDAPRFKKSAQALAPEADAPAAGDSQEPKPVDGGVDMSDFLRRLEDLTLDTAFLRKLLPKVGVSFMDPTATANAQYIFWWNHLYLPTALKDKDRNAVRYDLGPAEISTVIHELSHASVDIMASASAAEGSPERAQYDAIKDLTLQVRGGNVISRYPGMKADELAGYYLGCAIGGIASAHTYLRVHNVDGGPGARVADRAEAERLGGKVLNFDERASAAGQQQSPESWIAILHGRLDECDVAEVAKLGGASIGVEPRHDIKWKLYQNALGLKPPVFIREFTERLNDPKRNSPGIEALRAEIRAARLKRAGVQ